MAKRKALEEDDSKSNQRPHTEKRPKTSQVNPVTSARQLQQSLAFYQDDTASLRAGLRDFKAFLDSILYAEDKSSTHSAQALLKEFLQLQIPQNEGDQFFPSLAKAWDFAFQTNDDRLVSSISAIFALILKTISSLLDFVELGKSIVAGLLTEAHLKILSRLLNAVKSKDFVISPALRLLTEAVSFDGGSQARKVFNAHSYVFDIKVIARNLSLGRSADTKSDQPTVRSNTINYFLAHLKFQSNSTKIEILKQGMPFRAMFDGMQGDRPETIRYIISTLREQIINNSEIPRKVKGFVFTANNLSNIAAVYRRDSSTAKPVHEFLKLVCTDPSAGIVRKNTGLYPPGTIRQESGESAEVDISSDSRLGLAGIHWYRKFKTHVPTRNGLLSTFASQLKPYVNEMERELLLEIFKHVPEIVADYFYKSSFSFDPKLTATWIGYSTFLFEVVSQEMPLNFGFQDGSPPVPPPAAIVLESILPQPLNTKVLTRCLNQQNNLITYFAVRILIMASQKVEKCCHDFSLAAAVHGDVWIQAIQKLRDDFWLRCPPLKDVVAALKKTSKEQQLQKEALLRLITLYYDIAPHLIFSEKFDLGVMLDEGIDRLDKDETSKEGSTKTERLQLIHLLRITRITVGTRWFHKPETLRFSPVICLLKVAATKPDALPSFDLREYVGEIVTRNHDIIYGGDRGSTRPAVDTLLASLMTEGGWAASDSVFTWIDDVFGRYAKQPIKYLSDFLKIMGSHRKIGGPLSLVWMTILEQWPYVVSRADSVEDIAMWLKRLSRACSMTGESEKGLKQVLNMLSKTDGISKAARKALAADVDDAIRSSLKTLESRPLTGNDAARKALAADVDNSISSSLKTLELKPSTSKGAGDQTQATASRNESKPSRVGSDHFLPSADGESSEKELHRPSDMDLEEAVSSGALGNLMLCLSSPDSDISSLARANILNISRRFGDPQSQSTYSQTEQLYLLTGALSNTASRLVEAPQNAATGLDAQQRSTEIPAMVSVLASMMAPILAQPTHPLYAAMNRFLLRGPTWDPARLPAYWIHALLRSPPPDDTITAPQHNASTSLAQAALMLPESINGQVESSARFDRALHPLNILPASNPFPHNARHAGINFLLSYFYHALRSPVDVALLLRRASFEPILALRNDTSLPSALVELILGILWRATVVKGGSDALVTRVGIFTWLHSGILRAQGEKYVKGSLRNERELRLLAKAVWETCDRERAEAWGDGMVEEYVQLLLPVE